VTGDGRQLPTTRTIATFDAFVHALGVAWKRVYGDNLNPEATAMLWAQHQVETGGANCWNWNVGNVKKRDGDGHDWMYLNGVWECVPKMQADHLIQTGQARLSTTSWHKCGEGHVAVVFDPPSPVCRFRAFDSLERALYEHLLLLLNRYNDAVTQALAGDVAAFARALKRNGYFTASVDAYAASLEKYFSHALAALKGPPPEAA
jgi:hypothetical protein